MRYGAKPDAHDKRDYHLPRHLHLGVGAPLPDKADACYGLSLPAFDQGDLGSCTANAGAIYVRFLAQRFRDFDFVPSRLWLYYQERVLEGTVNEDAGAQSRTIFKVLTQLGIPTDADDPYDLTKFDASANDDPYLKDSAVSNKLGAYHRLDDVETMRACIASGYPFTVGVPVFESFEQLDAGAIIPVPRKGEKLKGGHEMFVRGCNDRALRAINSWGTDWAEGGEVWLPYDYLNCEAVQAEGGWDSWVGHLGKPWR